MEYDVPPAGNCGQVPDRWTPSPLGRAALRREGDDLTLVGVGVGVHRALEAAEELERDGAGCDVLDLRTVRPLDREAVTASALRTGRVLVVDEDYSEFGLSGEIAASVLEAGVRPSFARVAVMDTIPYDVRRERDALPSVARIVIAARELLGS